MTSVVNAVISASNNVNNNDNNRNNNNNDLNDNNNNVQVGNLGSMQMNVSSNLLLWHEYVLCFCIWQNVCDLS